MGRRSNRTYAIRAGSERWAFVPHPLASGLWFRTHLCTLVAVCPEVDCGSEPGWPCKHKGEYVSWTHYKRRAAARAGSRKIDDALGVVFEIERRKRRAGA